MRKHNISSYHFGLSIFIIYSQPFYNRNIYKLVFRFFILYSFMYVLIKKQINKILVKQCMKKNGYGCLTDDDWAVEQYIKKI